MLPPLRGSSTPDMLPGSRGLSAQAHPVDYVLGARGCHKRPREPPAAYPATRVQRAQMISLR